MHTFTEPHVYHSIREGRWCGNTDGRSEDLNPTNQNEERSPFALSERAKKKQGVSVRREGQGRGNTPQIVNAYSTQATVIKMMIVAPPNHRARSALCPNARKGNKEFPPRPPPPAGLPRDPLPHPSSCHGWASTPTLQAFQLPHPASSVPTLCSHHTHTQGIRPLLLLPLLLHSSDRQRETVFACLISLQTASEGCVCAGVARCCRGEEAERERESVCVCVCTTMCICQPESAVSG